MSEPFIGEIQIFAFNFAPRGWALCDGQILPISQNTALFSLIGTTYGGDGRTTFALPDMRGRVPIHPGRGPGLSLYVWGEKGGTEEVTLTMAQMPPHSHTAVAYGNGGNQITPVAHTWAQDATQSVLTYSGETPNQMMSPNAIQHTGGSQPHNNLEPILTLSFCIATQGIYPPRS